MTIAHRLGTIITNDRVLVMDAGRVAQFGHPHELMAMGPQASIFAALVEELGPAASAAMKERAEEAYKQKQQEQAPKEVPTASE